MISIANDVETFLSEMENHNIIQYYIPRYPKLIILYIAKTIKNNNTLRLCIIFINIYFIYILHLTAAYI